MNANVATPKVEKKFEKAKEVSTVLKNIVLEGVDILHADNVITTFEVTRELHPKTIPPFKVVSKKKVDEIVEPVCIHLVEVTSEELAGYRNSGISSFVLKVDGKLYYSEIPANLNFGDTTILGAHKCAVIGHECHRLSAASDDQGGCAKIRNDSSFIEKYPWITTGYETFNTKHDSFVVVNCLHYEKYPRRKKLSSTDSNNQ